MAQAILAQVFFSLILIGWDQVYSCNSFSQGEATMAVAPKQITITSCALGGHLLGRGTAVKNAIKEDMPQAEVCNKVGCPLQFSIQADDKQVLGGVQGTCTILKLLMCCTSPKEVAKCTSAQSEPDKAKSHEPPVGEQAMGA